MIYSEYQALYRAGLNLGLDESLLIGEYGGKCAVNGLIALKLSLVSPQYPRDEVIEINAENSNTTLAHLITCAGTQFNYGGASQYIAAAYLEDVQSRDIINNGVRKDFEFSNDYLVIDTFANTDYRRNYGPGSGLWGGFVHVEELKTKPLLYQSVVQPIKAFQNLSFISPQEKDTLWRAVQHSSPLERYLKLYHLIELRYDLEVVSEINNLGADLKGIGKLLNEYSGDKESERITKIIRKYCTDIAKYEAMLKQAFRNSKYHSQIIEILFEYGKENNPYKDRNDDFKNTLDKGFSVNELKSNKLSAELIHLTKLTAYIIYRVRCCIAHSKIGEYILSQADEEFVAEVAEPLLKAVLIEIYTP